MYVTRQHPTLNRLRTLAILTVGVLLLTIASPALAAEGGGSDRSWFAFLGRMHVLVLHLPIGLLAGAFAIELFGLFKRSKGFDIAAAWLFVFGAAASVVAVATGMLYGTEWAADNSGKEAMTVWQLLFADSIEQGVTETLGWHMWLGITLMVAAIVAAVLKVKAVRRQWPDEATAPHPGGWPLGASRLALLGAMAAMPFAGHLGGNMTHGQEFLVERAPFDVPEWAVVWPEPVDTSEPVADVTGNVSSEPDGTVAAWNTVIQPALNDSCISCHGTTKKNGGIRLDTLKYATEGEGLDYAVITAGDAQFSALHTVITLPQSHEMFMPPDPKDAFDQATVAFIGEWIQNYDGRLEDPQADDTDADAGSDQQDTTAAQAKPMIDPEALSAITTAGGTAQSLSLEENPDELTVKFTYLEELDPAVVAKLESGAGSIAWLSFEGSPFGDDAAQVLPAMPKLTTLNLKDSTITDAGLAELPDLPAIAWLNLFGTEVTDTGIESLKKYSHLEKLYLTGTKVTAAGVEALRLAMPNTEVFSDYDGQFQFTPVTPVHTPAPAKEKVSGVPTNDTCPVSGAPVKARFVSVFDGKTIGFCCQQCKAEFDAEPTKFAAKLQ